MNDFVEIFLFPFVYCYFSKGPGVNTKRGKLINSKTTKYHEDDYYRDLNTERQERGCVFIAFQSLILQWNGMP